MTQLATLELRVWKVSAGTYRVIFPILVGAGVEVVSIEAWRTEPLLDINTGARCSLDCRRGLRAKYT